MHTYSKLIALLLTATALFACDEQPEDRPRFIDRVRVIGLRSDPLTAKKGQDVSFSVLAQAPEFGDFNATWSWCPYRSKASDKYTCPVTFDRYRELIERAAARFDETVPESFWKKLPPFELGAGTDASFRHTLNTQETAILCLLTTLAAVEIDTSLQGYFHSVSCDQSFEISLRADVRHQQSNTQLVTRKSMFLNTGTFEPLKHPTVTTFQIRPANANQSEELAKRLTWLDATKPFDEQWVDIPSESIDLLRGYEYQVRVMVDRDSLDIYRPQELEQNKDEEDKNNDDPKGPFDDPEKTIEFLERVDYRWFRTIDVINRETNRERRLRELEEQNDDDPPDFDRFLEVQPLELERIRVIDLTAEENDSIEEVCDNFPCKGWAAVLVQDKQLGVNWREITFKIIE